jgi:aryl-alcohol dehydrogenase-like predicted oxidoreductase
MLRALDDLVHQGKVRYIACSNYEAWRLSEALWLSDVNGLARFECYQPQYSLVVRDIEEEIVPLCLYKGLGSVVWSPLAGGFLTGKYQPGQKVADGTRSAEGWAYPSKYFAPNADEILQVLLDVAKELGRSPAQVALRWILAQPGMTSVIVGARTTKHLQDNLGAADWQLEGETLARLNAVSQLPERYPKAMENVMVSRRNDAVKTG